MKVKSESEVAQSCPTLSDPKDCSLPGSSIHGIFQASAWAKMGTGSHSLLEGLDLTWLLATTFWFLHKLMTQFSNIHPKFYSELQILLPYCQVNISLWYHRTTQVQHVLNLNSAWLILYEVCLPLLLSLNSSSVLMFRPKILWSPTTPLFCTSHVHPTAIPLASI